jgi:hypothetical protein
VRATLVDAATRAQLSRDALVVADMLRRDLRYLGAGAPLATAACVDGGCDGKAFGAAVRMGLATELAFIGDLPDPNAELNGVVQLSRLGGDADSASVSLLSEVSGNCSPWASAAPATAQCSTSVSTMIPGTFIAAEDDCKSSNATARTCPWALNKWQKSGSSPVPLLAIDNLGRPRMRSWDGASTSTDGRYFNLQLSAGPSGGSAALVRDDFFQPVGGGYFSHLDRVVWTLESPAGAACSDGKCVVRRRQCWGAATDPTALSYPSVGRSTALLSTSTTEPIACTAPDSGTGWEVIATNVSALSFRYYNQTSTELATPLTAANALLVRAIEFELDMFATSPSGKVHKQTIRDRVFLANRDTN